MKYYFIYRNKLTNEFITPMISESEKSQEEMTKLLEDFNKDEKRERIAKQVFDKEMQELIDYKVNAKAEIIRMNKDCMKSFDDNIQELINAIEQLKDYVSEVDGK